MCQRGTADEVLACYRVEDTISITRSEIPQSDIAVLRQIALPQIGTASISALPLVPFGERQVLAIHKVAQQGRASAG